jgi:hypothetical protein
MTYSPITFLVAAAIAITAFSAHAQTTEYSHDGGRNSDSSCTTYADGSTSTTEYFFDRNNNLTTSRRTSTAAPVVAPTPVTAPAESTAPTYPTRVQAQASVNNVPVRMEPVVQPEIIVVPVSAAEMHAASLAGAARVKAQNEAATAAHKKKQGGSSSI